MSDETFCVGDRIVHLGELWYRDYQHRTGTVVGVNPCGTSYRGSRQHRWSSQVTKLHVRWDPLPCGRVDQTATSWVLADWCRRVPTATPGEPFAIRDGEAVPLYDLPESHALVAAVGEAWDTEAIPAHVLIALQPFRVPEPPPVVAVLRADDV